MLRAIFPLIIRSSNLYMQHVDKLGLSPNSSTLAVTANKFDKYPMCVYRFELLMTSGKPARNMYSVDNNKEYYTTLHLVGHA
jgi:hypothetical protein